MLPKKKLLLGLVVGLVTAGMAYILSGEVFFGKKNSLVNLISTKNNLFCELEIDRGQVYVADGKAKVVFSTYTDDGLIMSNLLVDSDTILMWFDGQEVAFNVSKEEVAGVTAFPSIGGKFNVEEKYKYKCKKIEPDESVFEVPTDLQFIDYREVNR